MIQKKIKKWYPTKEREMEAEESRRHVQHLMDNYNNIQFTLSGSWVEGLNSRYGHGNYMNINTETSGTYSHLGGAQTISWNDPNPVVFDSNQPHTQKIWEMMYGEQQNNKKTNWKLFKEDFGKWSWANFMMSFSIMSVMALIYSLLHYLLGEPIKIDKIPLPYYKELGFTLILYYSIVSVFWVLSKLWRIKAYISSTIKLIIYCITILPISVMQKSSISDKINNYLLNKFCTKKEKIIIENIIK